MQYETKTQINTDKSTHSEMDPVWSHRIWNWSQKSHWNAFFPELWFNPTLLLRIQRK